MKRFTTADLAIKFNVDKDAAYGFIRFLVGVEAAKRVGVRKPEGGRGRGEDVYELVEGYEKMITERLRSSGSEPGC